MRQLIKFEVLDQPKSAKKSNRARNPNAQKVAAHKPFEDLTGLVLVVNAEKVILDRVELDDHLQLIERNDEEKERLANELRHLIGTIARLEEEIYPMLVGELGIPPDRILRYHQGNKTHRVPPDAAADFALLDDPVSRRQIVLLVQIGKEGWDCRSLTGVILSQEGDCPRNMVLQTSCRHPQQSGLYVMMQSDRASEGGWDRFGVAGIELGASF